VNTVRKWIQSIFGFSGREVNGFIILLPLMVLIIVAQPLYHSWRSNRTVDFSQDQKVLDSLIASWNKSDSAKEQDDQTRVLFVFNPNTVSENELKALGFTQILARRIANYRQKGGEFRVKSDLMKIYGLDSSFYRQIYTYISLPENINRSYKAVNAFEKTTRNDVKTLFDLNTADTSQLKSVYGIGPALAMRIVRFREGLGGFVSHDQLREVYGLDSTVVIELVKKIYIKDDFVPRRIDLNMADRKVFEAHPYIKRALANAIVAYRFQHGNFTSVEDLRKLSLLKEAELNRLLPYLEINN
jgi:competence protein ComEA